MKAIVPNVFRTGQIVDGEHVNENLRAIARDVNRNLRARYTYSQAIVPLTGMADTDTTAARTISMVVPTDCRLTVVGVECVIYAASGVTWTGTVSDGTISDTFTVATAGATTKASGAISRVFSAAAAGSVSVVFTASAASTVTSGYMVIHCRMDRHSNEAGAALSFYAPAAFTATTSTAGSVVDTEITAISTARTTDLNNANDVRIECFLARNFGSAVTFNVPSGAGRTLLLAQLAVVAAGTESVTFAEGVNTMAVTGTGTSTTATGSWQANDHNDDPTDSTDDTAITFTPAGGTVELAYAFFWWS